jgi:hypothetical protein
VRLDAVRVRDVRELQGLQYACGQWSHHCQVHGRRRADANLARGGAAPQEHLIQPNEELADGFGSRPVEVRGRGSCVEHVVDPRDGRHHRRERRRDVDRCVGQRRQREHAALS